MSEILARWLNEDIHLSAEVKNFEKDFSNGYLLGELLSKYRLQKDFDQFINKNTLDAKVKNFTRLQPTFDLLDINFNSTLANNLMQEEKGTAARLLLQLRSVLEKLQKKGKANSVIGNPIRTPKEKFDKMKKITFEKRVRELISLTETGKSMSLNLKKYEDEKERQAKLAEDGELEEKRMRETMAAQRRKEHIENLKRNKELMKEWEKKDKEEHRRVQLQKKEREKEQLRFELTMAERENRKKEIAQLEAKEEVEKGILQFEQTLQRMGIDPKGRKGGKDVKDPKEAAAVSLRYMQETPVDHLRTLKTVAPDTTAMQTDVKQYMDRIRVKKGEETEGRKEREKRRRKVLVDQQRVHQQMEEKRKEEMLIEKLLKKSQEERRIAAELEKTRLHKEVMKENRMLREQKYEERRKEDFRIAMEKQRDIARREKEEYEKRVELEKERYQRMSEEKKRERYAKKYEMCKEMIGQVIDLSTKTVEYKRDSGDDLVPTRVWREWMSLFHRGLPLYEEEGEASTSRGEAATPAEEDVQGILDEADLVDYLEKKGDWEDGGEEYQDFEVGEVVSALDEIVNPPPPPPPPPKIPDFPEDVGLEVIKPKYLVQQALELLKSVQDGGEDAENSLSGLEKEKVEAAQEVEASISSGAQVPEEFVAQLVAIRTKELDEHSKPTGWVIDGYPVSLQSAKVLEKALTGYEEDTTPPAKGKPNIAPKKSKNVESDEKPLKSGLDVAVCLRLERDVVLSRAIGRRLDPETGEMYHLEYDPPPSDVLEKLVPVSEEKQEDAQLLHRLSSYEDEEPQLRDWFAKFNIWQDIDGNSNISDVASEVLGVVNELIEKKRQAELEAKAEEEAEAKEEEIAQAQESEQESKEVEIDTENAQETTAEAPKEAEPELSPSPGTRVEEEVKGIDPQLAELLLNQWKSVETEFLKGVKHSFRSLRLQRRSATQHVSETRDMFARYLKRPDTRQTVINEFQEEFNKIEPDMRRDLAVKNELHRRAEELRDRLWELCDEKKEETKKYLNEIKADSWLSENCSLIVEEFLNLMQLELDRFEGARRLLIDYHMVVESKLLEPVSKASETFTDIREGAAKGGGKGKGGKKEAKKGEAEDPLENALGIANSLIEEVKGKSDYPEQLRQALEKECSILLARFQIIQAKAKSSVEEMQARWEKLGQQLDEWIGSRYQAECDAVLGLVRNVQESVEDEEPLKFELRLEGEDFVMDKDVILVPGRSQLRPTTPKETALPSAQMTRSQILRLTHVLRLAAPQGTIENNDFVRIVLQKTRSSFGGEDYPSFWTEASKEALAKLAGEFDRSHSGRLDWRDLLISLSLPSIPSINNVLYLKSQFVEMIGEKSSAYVTKDEFVKVKFWFEMEPSKEESVGKLKEVLFDIFQKEKDGDFVVDVFEFLLFLCVDVQSIVGIQKAIACVSSDEGNNTVTAEELHTVFHKGGSVPVQSSEEDDFSIENIRLIFKELELEGSERISFEKLCSSSSGRIMLEGCQLYKRKDALSILKD